MIKKIPLAIFSALTANAVLALPARICASKITKEIESCAKENYVDADKELNKAYQIELKKLDSISTKELRNIQRLWVSYRDFHCAQDSDEPYPGDEAPIEKWECLRLTTISRTNEIKYIGRSYSMSDFHRAVTIIADIYEGKDSDKAMKIIYNYNSSENEGSWLKYRDANCDMTKRSLDEQKKYCVARMNFYRTW